MNDVAYLSGCVKRYIVACTNVKGFNDSNTVPLTNVKKRSSADVENNATLCLACNLRMYGCIIHRQECVLNT